MTLLKRVFDGHSGGEGRKERKGSLSLLKTVIVLKISSQETRVTHWSVIKILGKAVGN